MSKWNRWKLIHKETGMTFRQYYKSGLFQHGGISYKENDELIPVLLDSGYPAFYNKEPFYPYMEVLDAKDWKVIMKPASPEGVDK